MRLGRHGSMSSSEFESIISRNGNFLSVRRAESGAGLYNGISGEFICGIGNNRLPEYSRNIVPKYDCACTPGGHCRSGSHGIYMVRGWRNIMYELLSNGRIRISRQVKGLLGEKEAFDAKEYGMVAAPMNDPSPAWNYSSL